MTTTSKYLSHPKYRRDIDGLRAVAVLSVVAFHAFPDWMKGGFIGVDIFFVISGFLISTIIFENLDRGTFTFFEFYARRIKRIFPALLLVLIASFVFGWFALLADEYKQLGKHIAAGAGFVSNLVLWSEAGYFDNSAETKPLLHLWSLGIEEQFYIVWPFFLWFAWKKKFNLLTLTVILTLISFTLNLKGISENSVAIFYSPQTRFWELLSGSILAWFAIYKKNAFTSYKLMINDLLFKIFYKEDPETDNKTLSSITSFVGSLLLVYGCWRITKEVSFPGKWAVIPVAGSALIILAGPKAWINHTILSNKVAVWFGLISFPLYLWHWPLLSFARIIESEVPSYNIRIAAAVLSIVLAWLTYNLVERPILLGKGEKTKVTTLVVLMAVVGFIGYSAFERDGLRFRDAEKTVKINRFDVPYKESCEEITGEVYRDDWCNRGLKIDDAVSYVMLGDSHSNAYSTMLKSYSESIYNSFSFVQFGRGQCPSLLDYGPSYCKLITFKSYEYIKNNSKIKTVILSSYWPAYYNGKDFYWIKHIESKDAFIVSFEKTIKAYKDLGKNVIVFLAPPVGSNPKSCVVRPVRLKDRNICNLTKSKALKNDGDYRSYLVPFLDSVGVRYFDPFKYFCDELECKIIENGKIFSADGFHMSIFGGEFLARVGGEDFRKLLSY
jgi:peptidoglycan/LPS O-acetylase OafA/YrhL